MRRFGTAAVLAAGLGLGLLAAGTPAAHADFIPVLDSVTGSGPFTWHYQSDLTADEREVNSNYFVIYDFAGYVPNSIFAPAGWMAAAQNAGPIPFGVNPAAVDDNSGVTNLVFTYTGTPMDGPKDMTGFGAQSIYGVQTDGHFAAEATKQTGGVDDSSGPVRVPVVPEPASLAVLGVGLLPLLRLRRRLS